MARSAHTVILVTRRRVARADLDRALKVVALELRSRPAAPDLASAVELALAARQGLGARVWVLSSDVWTQTLSLETPRLAGLSDAEVAQALNFEAETLSGLSALESAVAFVPLSSNRQQRTFWVNQVPLAERDELQAVIRQAGARLAGLAHPGALADSGGPEGSASPRVELWPDAVVGTVPRPTASRAMQIWNQDPSGGRWRDEVNAWLREHGGTDRVIWQTADDFTDTTAPAQSLDDEATLRTWFEQTALVLTRRRESVPVITSAPRKPSARRPLALAGALTLLAAGVCVMHGLYLERQIAELTREQAAAQATLNRNQNTRRQIDATTKELAKLEAARIKAVQRSTKLETRKVRFARLLELLAQDKPQDVLILTIDQESGAVRVVTLALKPELSDTFARTLYEPLQALGWEVHPPKQTATNQSEDGGPWRCELLIKDTIDPAPKTAGEP